MQDATTLPEDLATCHTVITEQVAILTEQSARLDELSQQNSDYKREVEELNWTLRKLLEGHRREKFTSSPDQLTLEFADDPDLQEALQRARAEAEQITETNWPYYRMQDLFASSRATCGRCLDAQPLDVGQHSQWPGIRNRSAGEHPVAAVAIGLVTCPDNLFDFRVSRPGDGPAEVLTGYGGYVMADCYSGNLSVILSPESKMTRRA